MQTLHSRRSFLGSLSLAGAASLLSDDSLAQEGPLETTTVRMPTGTLICNAPTYIADELLSAEGFTDIQHVPVTPDRGGPPEPMERGELDFAMVYTPPMVAAIESGSPVTVLAGVHVGCNVLFAHEGIRTIRDLKGKKVGAGLVRQPLIASMAAYVGLDPGKDIEWVSSPFATAKELFVEHKIDAFLALPPDPQDLRAQHRARHRRQRSRSPVVAALLLRVRRLQGIRAQVPGGDQTCATRDPEGDRFLRQRSGGCRPAAGRWRLTGNYDYALQTLNEVWYNKWREYDIEDSVRFYALRLREAGMIKSTPSKIITDGTNWRFLKELKRELKD
jgi:NitT/TauT family transport system substrate-binding protein